MKILFRTFCCLIVSATIAYPAAFSKDIAKAKHKKYDEIPEAFCGIVIAGTVMIPDKDGFMRFPGKYVGTNAGFIDHTGKIVIEPRYDDAESFYEGYAAVKENGKWGFIDKDGDIVIEPIFNEISHFSEGLCAARLRRQWGFIDRTGKMIIAEQFQRLGDFSEGLCAAMQGDKWGFIDRSGKFVIQPQFKDMNVPVPFRDGIALVEVGQRHRLINKKGELLPDSALKADSPEYLKLNKDFELATRAAKIAGYEYYEPLFEGLILVKNNNGKFGFIDSNGKLLIKPKFTKASSFKENLAVVHVGGGYRPGSIYAKVSKVKPAIK
ncbi:MAG: WG repeat-containing protein [Candidatus Obscuribacterales bacterium]|nr:WG repeat-containing protein [Candidatus Obscuribacterales bacterium]